MKKTRTRQETELALKRQIGFIRVSAAAYDAGEKSEAVRLATSVATLVHDGKTSFSILGQLDLKGEKFLSTAKLSGREQGKLVHLIAHGGTNAVGYHPALGEGLPKDQHWVLFDEWWTGEKIFVEDSFSLTRHKLASILRSQEGGSHFDPVLRDPNYLRLQEPRTAPFTFGGQPPSNDLVDLEFASMRQIAYELVTTVEAFGACSGRV